MCVCGGVGACQQQGCFTYIAANIVCNKSLGLEGVGGSMSATRIRTRLHTKCGPYSQNFDHSMCFLSTTSN